MKPAQYRNRRPLEYLPNDFRLRLKSRRYYDRMFVVRRRRRKLPGIPVGVAGLVFLIAGELLKGGFGLTLFWIGVGFTAIGVHFELLNRLIHPYRYFIVPGVAMLLLLVYWIRPQTFGPILPKQYIPRLEAYSPGFAFNSHDLTVVLGGQNGIAVEFTKKQLEDARTDTLGGSALQLPFKAYLDSGKIFIDADVYAGANVPPIRIRRNVVSKLPYRWDGNYNSRAFEIVSPDTLPVFQFVFLTDDSVRVRGVFQDDGRLVIADESGVLRAKGKRVLFYGIKPIFKYPSWKYPVQNFNSY